MPKKSQGKEKYTAKDIFVLQGLEAVRKRPAMYIGSTDLEGLHHLLKEVVSNAIDEAIMGYCTKIEVVLQKDGFVRVSDNGRGIPVDIHPQTKKSALETVITHLHAGAKFGGKMYVTAGGLHGVGISAVCALSEKMKAEVKRDGFVWVQEYSRGKAITPLKKKGKTKETGTTIWFKPDPQIFPKTDFQKKRIIPYLREQAFLTSGVHIRFVDETDKESFSFYFESSLLAYLRYLLLGRPKRHEHVFIAQGRRGDIKVEVALAYTKEIEAQEISFANNIHTTEGGTHLTGFRMALTKVLNDWGKRQGLLKGDVSLTGQDVRGGMTAIVSVKIPEPLFEGQTKRKLTNPEARQVVYEIVSEKLTEFLDRYPKDGKEIISSALLARRARIAAKSAREAVIKKGVSRNIALSGKLADCTSKDPEKAELFIVEGDSAGGSGKQARDRSFQAILPLRGKILNVEKATLDKIMNSKEIKDLVVALGGGIGESFDINRLRYHKIIIMTDADSDGNHIKTLLLTLFWRYFRPVIEKGYLYVARPPLYRIEAGKESFYVFDDKEKEKKVDELKKRGIKNIKIQRFKGLGEMNPSQLWETTMDPERRKLYKVSVEDAQTADRIFDILMGEDVSSRKKFIQAKAQSANLDI